MFPVSDVIPSRTTPVVTIGLIALTAAAFLYELRLDPAGLQSVVTRFGVTPAELWWPAAVTSLFLHAGWVHVGSNLLYLWIFGDNVENALGHWGFLVFYLGCGAVAGLVQAAMHAWSHVPIVGGSGAIAGVLGAYLVLYPRSRVLTVVAVPVYLDLVEIPALFFLGVWLLLQLLSGVGSLGAPVADGGTLFWAHVAGFVTGAACGAYARFTAAPLRRYWE